jgi:transmembrane sensor
MFLDHSINEYQKVKHDRLDMLFKKLHAGACNVDEINELNAFLKIDKGMSLKNYLENEMQESSETIPENVSQKVWDNIQNNIDLRTPSKSSPKITYLYKSLVAASIIGILLFIFNIDNTPTLRQDSIVEFLNTSYDTISNITLPDGTAVRLHPESKISYVSKEKSRSIKLIGKATFDVVKKAEQPFEVFTTYSSTKVVGTVFTIDTQLDSIESVYLHEGKIEYQYKNQIDSMTLLTLGPSSQVLYSKHQKTLLSNVIQPHVIYRKGTSTIELNMASVTEVAEIIKVWYGVVIQVDIDIKDKLVHRIDTKTMKLEDVINDINLIANYKIEKYGDRYVIKKK